MAQLIKTDETITEIEPKNGTDFNLQELYEAIGCDTVEVVYLRDGRLMIVDEEGLYDSPVMNFTASEMAGTQIVGNVVVCNNDQLR